MSRSGGDGELLGADVVVVNPNGSAVWSGKGIAISYDPSIVIEQSNGNRISLPLAWAHLVAADHEQVIVSVDPASGHHMIVARIRDGRVHVTSYSQGGDIEAAVQARLRYDANPMGGDLVTSWLDAENRLTEAQYLAYQQQYRERRRG